MSWQIGVYSHDLFISEACAVDLFAAAKNDEIWHDLRAVRTRDGRLAFNPDHMEHMDFLGRRHIQAVLSKHKVNGTVTFQSAEGDNAGAAWGYQFTEGRLTKLKGHFVFSEAA